ncbi:hypothetical protein Tco_0829903 [Tanacetum coccineum]
MSTLAKFMILSSGDNRPPMLEKHLYDSWKSIMELYMQNKEHGIMILESVERGPLIWLMIEEYGAPNITLQEVPSDVYSLKERECKLYDAFDKFAHIKRESLQQYYLRFTQLINDMNVYKMKLEQFQVNTKFLNSLPPEWSKFVTDVKLVRDLHTTNLDQLNAYLEQHELYANEVCIMRERNQDPLELVMNHQMTPSHFNTYQSSYNNPHRQHLNQQTHLAEFPQIDTGLAVPVFKQGDDLIDAINKMISFMSTVVTSCFPTTNNQLRNSSNPRQQATIHDGKCPKPKRKRDATWFRDKVLLVEAQGSGKVLNEEELKFLVDPGVAKGLVTQMVITHNASYQADDLDAYDSNCDDFSIAKAVLMANLSSYRSNVLSERMR